MRIELAYISSRGQKLKSSAARALVDDFVQRATRYEPTQAVAHESERALLAALDKVSGRSPALLVLLDSRGDSLTSERIAERLGRCRDQGVQHLVYAVGPPDGWSPAAAGRAVARLSLGAITLPHELALAVLAEQIYRALTILAGHPYHGGHA